MVRVECWSTPHRSEGGQVDRRVLVDLLVDGDAAAAAPQLQDESIRGGVHGDVAILDFIHRGVAIVSAQVELTH